MPPGGAQEMLKAIHLSPVLHQLLCTDVSCPPDTESGGSHRVASYLPLPHSPSTVTWVKPCQLLPFSGRCQECLIQAAP